MLSALQQALQAAGGTVLPPALGEYRGATVPARFADPGSEFSALRSECGVYDLGFRNRIVLRGADRVRWLNGMVTNNVRDLPAGHGVYAFLLNPQGHILGDMHIYNQHDSLLVDTDRSQSEKILATFDHYIIMDDVEVTNQADVVTAVGISGPNTRSVLQAVDIQIPQLETLQIFDLRCDCQCGCLECLIIRGEDQQRESYEIWLAPAHVKALWGSLLAAGATPVGFEALEMQRIVAGIPLYGVDIRERDLPQETEQQRALNFNKGCYVGQEIVERIRSRGAVHRKFTGFLTEGAAHIAPGAKVIAGEKEAGEITSSTLLPFAGVARTLALGYIRREVGLPGREVSINGAKATVVQMPLDMSSGRPLVGRDVAGYVLPAETHP